MKDNSYAYAIDLSLRKGKNGQYSEPLVFECQPFISSNLGGSSNWKYKNAFKKAFPHAHMAIDDKTKLIADAPHYRILIKNSEDVSPNEFNIINQGKYYKYVHTGSFEKEIDNLNNKVYQRLYLPDEVSPEYRILQSNSLPNELAQEISNYFSPKGISQIVLKSAVEHEGHGNIFIDDIQDKAVLQKSVERMRSPHIKYFLAEEQKEFPRVSRKTGKEKPGHLSYRLVGLATQDGDMGHFIASKSISSNIDSHQREKMKCYFAESGKTHQSKNNGYLRPVDLKTNILV